MKKENKKYYPSDNKKKKNINNTEEFKQVSGEEGNGLIVLTVLGFVFLVIFISSLSFVLINEKEKMIQEEEKYVYTEETPQQVLESSKKVMKDIKTLKFNGVAKTDTLMIVESKNIPIDIASVIDIAISGGIDKTDLDNIKTHSNLDVEVDILAEGGGENISLDLDCITIGKDDLYYRLNDYDFGIMGIMLGNELRIYKGKWLMSGYTDEGSYSLEDDSNLLDFKEIDKYELLKFEEDLGDEKLGNIEVYHYKVKLDGVGFADLIEELQLSNKGYYYGVERLKDENKEELLNRIFENIYTELWIGKRDKYLYQIKIVGDYNTEDFKQIVSKMYGETEAKKEDSSTKSKISYIETSLKNHYKYSGSYDNFNASSYYARKIKSENIITDKDSYAIWEEMVATTDKWCVDSTGKSGYVQEEVEGSSCPKISTEPQGEKRNYEEYAYNFFEEEMGPDGKIKIKFDLDFSFSEFNKPLRIEKPKDVEKIMRVDNKDEIDSSSGFKEDNKIGYEGGDIENGYVLGESVSIYSGFERMFDFFQ